MKFNNKRKALVYAGVVGVTLSAKIRCYRFFNFALEVEICMKNLQKRCFTLAGRL